ncbi:O147 family O-antigen polymerase [Aeromonas veronii]|uniref:O147 family O-antigen polymerase n=1 Tax=Aeromonas veronii TaxID=654 RepID=UPI003D1C6DDF
MLKIVYFISIFLLTRQFPLTQFSWLMNISVLLLFAFSYKGMLASLSNDIFSSIFMCVLILFTYYSLHLGNEPELVTRFFLVMCFVILSYHIDPKSIRIDTFFVKWFLYLLLLQAIIVILIEIYMVVEFGTKPYGAVRSYFLNSGFGDVYTYGNGFYKVQIKGNALLPVAFMLSFIQTMGHKKIKYILISITLFVAIIFAGNFAFQLSAFAFTTLHLMRFFLKQGNMKFVFPMSMLLLFLTIAFAVPYAKDVIESKSGGASSSIGTRYDQLNVLIDDLTATTSTTLFGQGLGHTINISTFARDYSSYIYYELQSIYILNQVGIFVFIIFLVLNVYLSFKKIKSSKVRWIYLLYCFYAASNPYMLDTNHVLAIVVLISFSRLYSLNYSDRRVM